MRAVIYRFNGAATGDRITTAAIAIQNAQKDILQDYTPNTLTPIVIQRGVPTLTLIYKGRVKIGDIDKTLKSAFTDKELPVVTGTERTESENYSARTKSYEYSFGKGIRDLTTDEFRNPVAEIPDLDANMDFKRPRVTITCNQFNLT